MASSSEKSFETELRRKLVSVGADVTKLHGNSYQRPGLPDLYIASRMWSGWLELKAGNGKVEAIQWKVIKRFRDRFVSAYVLRSKLGEWYLERSPDDSTRLCGEEISAREFLEMLRALWKADLKLLRISGSKIDGPDLDEICELGPGF